MRSIVHLFSKAIIKTRQSNTHTYTRHNQAALCVYLFEDTPVSTRKVLDVCISPSAIARGFIT